MQWFNLLSVPKMIGVLCLLGLGVNGLVQVGIQKDMAQKTAKLKAQVEQSQALSSDMKGSLNGLSDLQQSTSHMENTLSKLDSATSDMNTGLATLSTTVSGLDSAINQIAGMTSGSKAQIEKAIETAQTMVNALSDITNLNGHVIQNLSQMSSDESSINNNLKDMNRKLQIIPN